MTRSALVRRCCAAALATAIVCLLAAGPVLAAGSPKAEAERILQATGIKGGLVIHVGCGDGTLTAALHANDRYLVQGLDTDAANVAAAREHIASQGAYGPVSADTFDGARLPYAENLANLLVAEDLGKVTADEAMRVLAPGGVLCTKRDGKWTPATKPRPDEIDEWTHYLHDPTNNAVAHDSVVAPPRRYQWVAGQRYSRQHDHMSSVSAVVTANGRVFYIFDDAPRASIITPPQWHLIARDAFNGTVLWQRDITPWHEHLWPLKSGPQILARRLVAVGDRVYVTLGTDASLLALDAATGKTIRTYDDTKVTEEILCDRGVLFLSVAAKGQPLRSDPAVKYDAMAEIRRANTGPLWAEAPRTIMAVDAQSGRVLWKKTSNLVSLSLAADAQRVVFHDGDKVQCLDRAAGRPMWSSEPIPSKTPMRSSSGGTMVIAGDVILYSGMTAAEKYPDNRTTTCFALSAEDGRTLWKAPLLPCGHMGTPDDILVAGGLVWHGEIAQGRDSGVTIGRDLHTGEIKSQFPPDVKTHWFHHRCYRAKATEKYLLYSRTGIEFVDPATKHWTCNHWVRGACHYGVMPANGLIYAPPHPCACYIEAKLFGFSALAPAPKTGSLPREVPDDGRLQKGPAYDSEISSLKSQISDSAWPTFRRDAARSGSTSADVAPKGLKCAWETALGGRLSSPVLAAGKLFVASVDTHTVHALDAATGRPAWQFTAGGRVDSPPTIWQGRALFGSADGYVYCVNAADGRLVWRFRAAPEDRRMGAFDQVESCWPVHGSVLVQDGVLYCVAGRSMFLDGGLRLLRLDPTSGRKLSETILDDRDPASGDNLQVHIQGLNMPVGLPDILSSDGKYVYMRSLPFTMDGKRKFVEYVNVNDQEGDDVHLFSPTGFLDDTLWHRTYWVYGRAFASGAGGYYRAGRLVPAGRLLVFDDDNVYGYGRLWKYYRWTTPLEYQLFGVGKTAKVVKAGIERKPIKKAGKRTGKSREIAVTRFVPNWANDVSVQTTALVLTKHTLFVAGVPDVEDEEEAAKSLSQPQTVRLLARQNDAFEGRLGGLLLAVSPKDGRKLAAYKLDAMPRFDGLIAVPGRLYLVTADGKVLCLGADGKPLAPADVTVAPRPQVAAK